MLALELGHGQGLLLLRGRRLQRLQGQDAPVPHTLLIALLLVATGPDTCEYDEHDGERQKAECACRGRGRKVHWSTGQMHRGADGRRTQRERGTSRPPLYKDDYVIDYCGSNIASRSQGTNLDEQPVMYHHPGSSNPQSRVFVDERASE